MTTRQHIPSDLAQRAPGPELAAALAEVELSRLSGFDAAEVLQAEYRQLAHTQARVLAVLAEVGCCEDAESLARSEPGMFAAEEARAALVWTRRRAEEEFRFAYDLLTRLPGVHTAMAAGDCDRARAWIFCEWTRDLTDEQARAVTGRLLPRVAAGELTTGQLIEALKRAAIAVDPDWARRRYEAAVGERKVVGTRNPDGTANLGGYNLPVERVAASAAHIDALAEAAKRTGSRRRLDHLRAELFLGMTDGAYTGLDDDAIVAELLAGPTVDNDTTEAGEPTLGAEPVDGRGPTEVARDGTDGEGAGADVEPPAAAAVSRRGRGGMELRVRLSTLLGHDRYPGELAGWGPIHAELATTVVRRMARGQWWWVLTDSDGHLRDAGMTRTRPTGWTTGPRDAHVVELQIPETLLDELDEADPWAPVLTDIARQRHAHTAHENESGRGGRFVGEADRRHPGSAQRRWLQIRDRSCVGHGCRAPARATQQDHTIDHARGGPTLHWNLGGLCGHDHRVKTEGGWRLTQDQPGHFRWTSRLGHVYEVPPRPVTEPLPEPIPRDNPDADDLGLPLWCTRGRDSILDDPPPPKPEPEPPPPKPPSDPDEPPPF